MTKITDVYSDFPEGHLTKQDGYDGHKVGVLLISLGTPEALTIGAVRKYLKEFLWDRRVVEVPRFIWWFILNMIILTFRPMKSLANYRKIWNHEDDESPLRTYARKQSEAMAEVLKGQAEVEWAFRYGNPSIKDKLEKLKEAGCERILLFALYPQYSASTVASAYDEAFDVLKNMRWQPAIRTMPAFHDDPQYIDQLAKSVEDYLAENQFKPDALLASFHSLPKKYWDKGDPYPCQCQVTARLLAERLKYNKGELKTVFQSRFGSLEWVGPQADDTVEELAQEGVKKIAVVAPAFMADCLETLEELDIALRASFMEAGGTEFHYIPCLNDSEYGIKTIHHILRTEGAGWLKAD